MVGISEVESLDPNLPAPPLLVKVNRAADMPGHGRILPLVGGRRNYLLDVVFDDGRQRVYADDVGGVLAKIIDGYEPAFHALGAAEQLGDRGRIIQAANALFMLRAEHARRMRMELQQRINAEAVSSGAWDRLSDEEQEQCEAGALGLIPVGVMVEEPYEDPDGNPIVIERGVWETNAVQLVIDRGDYGLFDPEGTPEPTSEYAELGEDGRWYVLGGKHPVNMVILDSTDGDEYMSSLEQAKLITVEIYSPDVEDATYLAALRLGRNIMEAEQFDMSAMVGFADSRPREEHHDHEHDHDGHDHDGHDHGDGGQS